MKFFIAIALIASVASAAYLKPTGLTDEMSQIAEIVAAIQSPSTDPATAVALEQMLYEALGIPQPAIETPVVGPALVEIPEAIAVGPTLVDIAPVEETAVSPVVVAPAVVAPETPSSSNPLVQIILNINQAPADVASIAPVDAAPVTVDPAVVPEAVSVVDAAPEVVSVVDATPEVVSVVDAAPEAVSVVELAPEVVSIVEAPASVSPIIITQPATPTFVHPE